MVPGGPRVRFDLQEGGDLLVQLLHLEPRLRLPLLRPARLQPGGCDVRSDLNPSSSAIAAQCRRVLSADWH